LFGEISLYCERNQKSGCEGKLVAICRDAEVYIRIERLDGHIIFQESHMIAERYKLLSIHIAIDEQTFFGIDTVGET
jgi:hypothetical protein